MLNAVFFSDKYKAKKSAANFLHLKNHEYLMKRI